MDIIGVIKKINEIQTFNSGFKKRELILTINDRYPQDICIEFIQEKIDLLDSCKEGDNIKVFINLRGREWTSPDGVVKYFNSIHGWRIEKINNSINDNFMEEEKEKSNDNELLSSNDEIDSNNSKNSNDSNDFSDLPF